MIYTITAANPKFETVDMVLAHPERSGLNVMNVTGISPVGAEIYSTPFATIDGGLYSGSRVPSRNIVLTIGMWPKDLGNGEVGTIEDSRLILYNFFRIKDPVTLVFYTDNRILQVTGYTESVEVDIFSDKEVATVSVVCVDPWFHSSINRQIGFSGTIPAFEFPFSNEDLVEPLLEFGTISIDTRTDINYEGDVKTGFRMNIVFYGTDFHNIYFYNMQTRERMNIYTDQIEAITGSPLRPGDELLISTVSGSKTAYLLRNGMLTNVISAIDKNATWFQLTKGGNIFAFASDHGVENISITLSYQDAYAGI